MNGAFPPNSRESFLTVSALCRISVRPTSVEPVNVTLRTSGFDVISPPISRELPVSTLNTPGGTPARSPSTARAKAEKGVARAGFVIIGQPAARAGPSFRVIIAAGKFQGVTAAQTPIGSLITTSPRLLPGAGVVSPYTRLS